LHAGVDIAPHQREKLERLCRYMSRPPVASERPAPRQGMLSPDLGLAAFGAGSPEGRRPESAGLDGWFEFTIHTAIACYSCNS
jgi:hypothetical protein